MKQKRDFHGKVVERRKKSLEEYQSAGMEKTEVGTSQSAADEADIQV